jgi:hypothetical protein
MLDLTYLYENEPIVPGEPVVIDTLSHPLLTRVLYEELSNLGYKWSKAMSCNTLSTYQESYGPIVVADIKFGAMNSHHYLHDNSLIPWLDSIVEMFRFRHPEDKRLYKIYCATVQSSNTNANVWFTFHVMRR